MKTDKHWKEWENTPAHCEAIRHALSLSEYAKLMGYQYKGIKVLTKREAHERGHPVADSQILWEDGPEDWAYLVESQPVDPAVGSFVSTSDSISFYVL